MNNYEEIETLIKKVEIGKSIRESQENRELVDAYWNIGKLIIDAQGGKDKAKYGDALLKKWSEKLSIKYGKGYNYTNMKRFRQFFLNFSLREVANLKWSQIRMLLPIKDINKRNYYINMCNKMNISKRDLEKEIKNNSYERLLNKPDKIDIDVPSPKSTIKDNLKNPIVLELKNNKIKKEKDLEKLIYTQLNEFFSQLGEGFMWVGNQYKITADNKDYYIDMLLYNIIYNCYIVVELKLRKLKKEDKAQVEFYMNLVDEYKKEPNVGSTLGLIITKEQNKLIANFVKSEKLIPLTYKLI